MAGLPPGGHQILSRLSIFSPQKMTKNFAETFRKKKDSLFYKKERELAQFIIKTEFEHHITKGVSHLYKQLRYDSTKNTWV